jgi:hypothetical protein
MYYPDPIERHRKFRIFFGRLVELQCIEWLESQGWAVSRFEAFREGPDIEAYTGDNRITAFEVKFIGEEDVDFDIGLRSLAGQPSGRSVSPYVAANYLLFRAYEAAKQLQRMTCDRIAMLVVHDQTWYRFELPLRSNWIDWANPKFFPGDDAWKEFLARQQTRYPELAAGLQPALRSLNAVWILRLSYGYQYDCEVEVRISFHSQKV